MEKRNWACLKGGDAAAPLILGKDGRTAFAAGGARQR